MSREDIAIILTFTIVFVLAVICGIVWHLIDYIKSKRPHKSDDEDDNPIAKFKDDLVEAFENHPNRSVRKLARAIWDRLVQIEKWHDEEIRDRERREYSARWTVGELESKCEHYQSELDEWTQRCEELQSKLNESQERLKRTSAREKTLLSEAEGLRKQLREEQEKNKIQLFERPTEAPEYLICENAFGSQINPFARIILNTNGEPLTATELSERLQRIASQPLVSKEDVVEKLIDF